MRRRVCLPCPPAAGTKRAGRSPSRGAPSGAARSNAILPTTTTKPSQHQPDREAPGFCSRLFCADLVTVSASGEPRRGHRPTVGRASISPSAVVAGSQAESRVAPPAPAETPTAKRTYGTLVWERMQHDTFPNRRCPFRRPALALTGEVFSTPDEAGDGEYPGENSTDPSSTSQCGARSAESCARRARISIRATRSGLRDPVSREHHSNSQVSGVTELPPPTDAKRHQATRAAPAPASTS